MSYDKKFMAIKDLPPSPQVPKGANYILSRKVGNLLILSGNGPLIGNKIPPEYIGKLGKELTTKQGYNASRLSCMNLLLVARSVLGTLDKVDYIVNIEGTVNCTDDFMEQPAVINGCSDLLIDIFEDAGKHTRSALGTNSLAFNIAVEISMSIAIK